MTIPHEPDAESRIKVADFSCAGLTQDQIADYLDIDVKTLRKHYRSELDKSLADKNSAIARGLFKRALDGDAGAQEFWLKCRAKWHFYKPPEEKNTNTDTLLEKLIDKL